MKKAKADVYIYRNLRQKCWSIRSASGPNRGRVINHSTALILTDVEMKVSLAGRARVLKEKRKNVHAGIAGSYVNVDNNLTDIPSYNWIEVTYNPYKNETFVIKNSGEPIYSAKYAIFESTGTVLVSGKN